MKIFCKGACCIFVFLSCLPSCFWHGYFCVAYGYFCGMNLGVMHVGLEFNWKGILLMNWTGISQQLKIWCFLECTWKACIKLLHTPFWICLFFFPSFFQMFWIWSLKLLSSLYRAALGTWKREQETLLIPRIEWIMLSILYPQMNKKVGEQNKLLEPKMMIFLFVKKSRWFNHIDTAFKVLHAGFVFYHDYDRKLYLLFG